MSSTCRRFALLCILLEVVKHAEIGFIDQQEQVLIGVISRDRLLEQQKGFGFGDAS
jgi:hypothetical protein